MTVTTFYFSGAGNTQFAVHALDQAFHTCGASSAVYAIEDGMTDETLLSLLSRSDVIGFAYPLFGANIPRIMQKFMARVTSAAIAANITGKKVFFVNTFAYVNGHGVFNAKKTVKLAGFKLVGYINLRFLNSAPAKKNHRPKLGQKAPEKIKQRAICRINRFVHRLMKEKRTIHGIGPHLVMGILIRRILRDEIKKNYLNMWVDKEKCTACMQCVKHCPVSCISYKNGTFTFQSSCEACMRCYHLCPVQAISNVPA